MEVRKLVCKTQGRTSTPLYGKVRQQYAVVKDVTGQVSEQGGSHMGEHVCTHVKSNSNHGLSTNNGGVDRFVHVNQFQPLYTCDVESSIESKCRNEDSTCANNGSQEVGLHAIVTVKDRNKYVRGKEINSSKRGNPVGNGKASGSTKSAGSKLLSISRVPKAFSGDEGQQMAANTCESTGNDNIKKVGDNTVNKYALEL